MDYDVVIAGAGPVWLASRLRTKVGWSLSPRPRENARPELSSQGRAHRRQRTQHTLHRGLLLARPAPRAQQSSALVGQPVGCPAIGQRSFSGFSTAGPQQRSSRSQRTSCRARESASHVRRPLRRNLLDANVVNDADPEFAGHGPAAAGGMITMQAIEALLADRAAELGVEIKRGAPLTNFTADADGVTIQTDGETFRAGWLVGCDGGRSTVRKLAGFDFPGTDPEITGYNAMVSIADPEKLSPGWNRTAKGTYVNGPVPGRILTVEFDGPPADREAPITVETLQQSLRNVSQTDVTITAIHSATRWTDNARQASNYRQGRVLLAGDAAHVNRPSEAKGSISASATPSISDGNSPRPSRMGARIAARHLHHRAPSHWRLGTRMDPPRPGRSHAPRTP